MAPVPKSTPWQITAAEDTANSFGHFSSSSSAFESVVNGEWNGLPDFPSRQPPPGGILMSYPGPRPGRVIPTTAFFLPRRPFGHGSGEPSWRVQRRGLSDGVAGSGATVEACISSSAHCVHWPLPGAPANPHLVAFLGFPAERPSLRELARQASPRALRCLSAAAKALSGPHPLWATEPQWPAASAPEMYHPPDYTWSLPPWIPFASCSSLLNDLYVIDDWTDPPRKPAAFDVQEKHSFMTALHRKGQFINAD